MAFFDKLGETISSKSKDVAKKTKDFAEVTSLNSQINSQEDIIRNAYTEIGRAYFEAHRNQTEDPYMQQMQKIFAAQAAIEEKKQRIREIKGVKTCEHCGAEIPLGTTFCGNCGSKVEEPVSPIQPVPALEEKPAAIHCPQCGIELPADAAFCTSCGCKIQ